MKITKRQLRRIIREQMEEPPVEETQENPNVQIILDQMEEMTIDDLRTIWQAVADISKRKQSELKAGFKKGDKVEFDHDGKTLTGTVTHRGAKFVSVNVRGWSKPWKRNPSNLRKI